MSSPKTLSERLRWMADNLPGFRQELDAAQLALSAVIAKRCSGVPSRANARVGTPLQRTGGLA